MGFMQAAELQFMSQDQSELVRGSGEREREAAYKPFSVKLCAFVDKCGILIGQ